MSNIDPIVTEIDQTTLASANYNSTVVLNQAFELLRNMLSSVQNVAAVQAQRLTFYSNWQNYYTDLMAKVPNVTEEVKISGDSTELGNASSFNSNLIQTMQNRQSVVGDDTKQMQTVVNQSNDAATSQADLGASILQELGTLLPIVMGR